MPKKKTTQPEASFADQFTELERIVESFESKKLDLDEGLRQFERGLQLATSLRKTLENVENRIVTLKTRYHVDENIDESPSE